MKIKVEVIDKKGGWHCKVVNSREVAEKIIDRLNGEVRWISRDHVHINKQFSNRGLTEMRGL